MVRGCTQARPLTAALPLTTATKLVLFHCDFQVAFIGRDFFVLLIFNACPPQSSVRRYIV